jgi:hypothetical protein
MLSDRLLDLEPVDWVGRIGTRWDQGRAVARTAEKRAEELRRPGTRPPRALTEYEGEYEHPGYGIIRVENAGQDRLVASFHGIEMPLEHWHFETFRASSTDKALADLKLFLQFVPDTSGEIVRLEAPFEVLLPPVHFARLPPARLSDPKFLEQLTGAYVPDEAPDRPLTIEAAGEVLRLKVPGQPVYKLLPRRGTEFAIEGLDGFRVRFVLDSAGRATELMFLQPDGVYTARRKP